MSETTNSPGRCQNCGAALSDGTPDGMCARCLLMGALTPPREEPVAPHEVHSPAMLLARREFAGYELREEIARGGMGVVFRARQRRPERTVALKVITTGELASPAAVERFRTEAEAAARLEHPNIVPVFEVGQHDHWHFFSMRLIEGPTLGAALAGQPMAPEKAVPLMVKVARAVHHAHQRGVLHRDLKPNNILLDAQGEPHLTDFGLAKLIESSVVLTQSDMAVGTPSYMAPEQASGNSRDLTMAVDVYGLGVVLYEMLTGRPPFRAPNVPALLRMIVEDDPVPPSQVHGNRRKSALVRAAEAARGKSRAHTAQVLASSAAANELLSDLDAICLKCLEKNPALRYPSAAEFANDLERALCHDTILARPSTRTQRIRKWVQRNRAKTALLITAAAALAIITIGSLAFNVRLNRARGEAERYANDARRELVSKHLHDASRLAAEGDAFVGALALSQAYDGSAGDPARRQSIVERLNATYQLSPRLLRLRAFNGVPVKLEFLSSEDLNVTLRDGSTQLWNLPTNHLTALPGRVTVPGPESSLSPDCAWELEVMKGGNLIELWSVEGGTNIASYTMSGPLFAINFSPDSASFAVAAFHDQATIYDSATGKPRGQPLTHESGANQALFSPDGTLLVTAGFDYQLRVYHAARRQLAAPIMHHAALVQAVAFSPDGLLLAAGDVEGVVQVWDLATAARPVLLNGEVRRRGVVRPDGKLVILIGDDHALHACDVLTGEEQGAPMPVPANLGVMNFDPSGRWLGVACRRSGARIFDFQTRRLVAEIRDAGAATMDIANVAFSPDGKTMATTTYNGVVQRWNVADGRALGPPMMRNEATMPIFWSADGKWISTGGGRSAHVWDAATGQLLGVPVRLNQGETVEDCRFSPDGRRILIAYSNESIEPAAAQLFDLPSLKPVGVPLRHGDGIRNTWFSPDGRFIATAGEDNVARIWHARDGSPASPPLRHQGIVFGLAFRRDGRVLASGGTDGMLRLWDTERGELMAPPLQLDSVINGMRLYGDGDVVVTGSGNQTWAVPLAQHHTPSVLQHLAECQTGRRLETNLGITTIPPAELEQRFAALTASEPSIAAWPQDFPHWHLERAAIAESSKNWFAAVFHLQRLAAMKLDDTAIRKRLEAARANLEDVAPVQ